MNLSNIVSADIRRIDRGGFVYAEITLVLVGGGTWKLIGGIYLNPEDIDKFKNGTNAEKSAIRRKYIRQAIQNYLDSLIQEPASVDAGTATATKAQLTEPGDIT